jgi:hypothetical protein
MDRIQTLSSIMQRACDRLYRGNGHELAVESRERIAQYLEEDPRLAVLRSENFARHFWGIKLIAFSHTGATPPSSLLYQEITEAMLDAWKPHYAALQATVDPIAYIVANSEDMK